MAAGLAAVIGGPLALGVGGYALGKILSQPTSSIMGALTSKKPLASVPKSKNLDKKRQPLAQAYKKIYLLNKVKDFGASYIGSTQTSDQDISQSEGIYKTFLNPNNLTNTLDNPSPRFFSKRIEGLLKVVQDNTLSSKDRDRILFLAGWLTLMF